MTTTNAILRIDRRTGAIRETFHCERCGGETPRGALGLAIRAAAATPSRHCVCPGGPVWTRLLGTPAGQEMHLSLGHYAWQKQARQDLIPVCIDDRWRVMPLIEWQSFLRRNWPGLSDPDSRMAVRWPAEIVEVGA